MRIYIAGPMTGLPNLNYDAFHDAAARLRAVKIEEDLAQRLGFDIRPVEGWLSASTLAEVFDAA